MSGPPRVVPPPSRNHGSVARPKPVVVPPPSKATKRSGPAADPFQLAEDVAGASMISDLEGTAAIEDAADDDSVDVARLPASHLDFCTRCPFGSLRSCLNVLSSKVGAGVGAMTPMSYAPSELSQEDVQGVEEAEEASGESEAGSVITGFGSESCSESSTSSETSAAADDDSDDASAGSGLDQDDPDDNDDQPAPARRRQRPAALDVGAVNEGLPIKRQRRDETFEWRGFRFTFRPAAEGKNPGFMVLCRYHSRGHVQSRCTRTVTWRPNVEGERDLTIRKLKTWCVKAPLYNFVGADPARKDHQAHDKAEQPLADDALDAAPLPPLPEHG